VSVHSVRERGELIVRRKPAHFDAEGKSYFGAKESRSIVELSSAESSVPTA